MFTLKMHEIFFRGLGVGGFLSAFCLEFVFTAAFVSFQAISVVVPAAGRGAENRPDDGNVRPALLPAEPGHLHQHRHVLRPELRHHYAEHVAAQPVGEGQADRRAVHLDEPRHQQRRRLAARAAGVVVRVHPHRALQDPARRRQRSHAHVLQPRQGGLAVEAGRAIQELEAAVVHPQRQLLVLLRIHD